MDRDKQKIIEKRDKELSEKKKLVTSSIKRDNGKPFPLSFSQQHLWIVDQVNPGNPAYNVPIALKLKGKLNFDLLEKAINKVIQRHEILRTSFGTVKNQPVQFIHSELQVKINKIDLQALSSDEQVKETRLQLSSKVKKSFDLSKLPLIKIFLFQLDEETNILFLNIHHIVADGLSIAIILKELEAIYNNEEDILPEIKLQYADYSLSNTEDFEIKKYENELTYWKNIFNDELPLLDLPLDKQRPVVQTFSGKNVFFSIDKATTDKLKTIAQENGSTIFMILLAAYYMLLQRYSSQEDIIIGVPVSTRTKNEYSKMVGYFLNMTALRINIQNNPTFIELLQKVTQITIDGFTNQNLPFEKVVENINFKRDLSRNPIFQTTIEVSPSSSFNLNGLEVEKIQLDTEFSQVDIALHLSENETGFSGRFEYNTDLFRHSTIDLMKNNFLKLLEEIVEQPNERVSNYSILSIKDISVLDEINNNNLDFSNSKILPKLFELQAYNTPDNIALVFENRELTYKELNELSNSLANRLIEQGVKPGDTVAISLERSIELIIGLLGILKTGAAYIPLDSNYPVDRLIFMLNSSESNYLIINSLSQEKFSEFKGNKILFNNIDNLSEYSFVAPEVSIKAEDIAYIIYTSGSTGKPKGVANTHKGITNYLLALQHYFDLSENEIALQKTPISFDVSVREIFLPLISGCKLVLAKPDGHKDNKYLITLIKEKEISFISFVPSQLSYFLEEPNVEECTSLKQAVVSGEALSIKVKNLLFEKLTAKLDNLYGPTEAAVDVTRWQCKHNSELTAVPIGKPITNNKIYILNKKGNRVPVNAFGEIHIGGVQLAKGYFKNQDLTNEKFIPDNFLSDSEARMYKTGDLGRVLPNGNIEYLRRIDNQVKLRGFRIELGEIEAVLTQYDGISNSVVILHEDKLKDKKLAAYIIVYDKSNFSVGDLKTFMSNKLPDYMIPSYIVLVDSFPLTPNGKLDKKKLPPPEESRLSETVFVPANNQIEKSIEEVWKKYLNIDNIGIDDNFFDLGGHSLLAARLIAQIEKKLGINLPLALLFQFPSIRKLAEKISRDYTSDLNKGKNNFVGYDRPEFPPLSFAQQRLWFLDNYEPHMPVYNIPLAYEIESNIEISLFEDAVNLVVKRNEILRTRFKLNGDTPIQDVVTNHKVSIPFLDLTIGDKKDIKDDILVKLSTNAQTTFDLNQIPLFRGYIFKTGENNFVLQFVFHHIIFDGLSINLFFEELSDYYNILMSGNNNPEKNPLNIQYADYTTWQRKWLNSKSYYEQLNYWKEQLKDSSTILELPTDFQRPSSQKFDGDLELFTIKKDLLKRLINISVKENASLFMLLLAALSIILSKYSKQKDVLIGTVISTRNRTELENLIGFFVNNLVLRLKPTPDKTFIELLHESREICLAGYQNQELPFEKLVDELSLKRDLSRTSLFQILFSYQDTNKNKLAFADSKLERIPIHANVSRTDLSIWIEKNGEQLDGMIEYCTHLFHKDTIIRFISNLHTLLDDITGNPEKLIGDLEIISKKERERILVEWNRTETELTEKENLISLIEAQVKIIGEETAVQSGKKALSYSELNERVNQLAHHLINSGVKPGDYIGVCIDRSVEVLVAMLAVLKTGAAFVPMDPIFPVERLGYMIEDADISLVVTESKLENIFKDFKVTKILVDKDSERINAEHKENPGIKINPDQLAYVIFTSGSTGRPKGVQLEHRPVINFLLSMQKEPGLSSEDTLLSVTTISFDISVLELFLPLITGAKLIIADKTTASDGKLLIREIKEKAVTVMQATPSTWKLMIEVGWKRSPGLKMLCGGEALPLELAKQMLERGKELWNMYGPTETTVWSSVKRIEPEDDVIFIGPPIANTQFYIVDEHLNPVPIGVPGELLIGGDGLARGYLNRDELTEEKFIKNPFIEGESKLYRTGDLARFKNNGDIEFLGRIDNQVKIRGFRIELGEIEKVLSGFDGIKDAVVNAWTDSKGDKKLVGYYIPDTGEELKLSKIKEYLREELPEYMIPSYFLKLGKFPLTPNNKTDRKALPQPETEEITTEEKYVAPGDEIEKQLAEIWQKVLGVKSVGINDNFFDLGGHSLLAAQLFAQIEKKMQVNLPLALLFQSPTIKQLAKIIRDDEWKTTWQSLVPIKEKGDKPPLFLIHGAEGNVLLYKELANYLPDDQPVYGLQSKGLDGVSEIHARFEDMAADYIKEIKEVQPSGPYLLGGYCLGGAIAYEIAQQLRDDGREIAVLAMFETFNFHYIKDKIPKYYKYLHTVQNFYFHWENILRAGLKDSTKFLRQKFAVEFSRLKLKSSVLFSSVKERFSSSKSLNFHHLEIVEVNDKAQINYIPKKYDGQVLLFKPKKDYAGFEDKFQGWGELADGRIKIIEVPASPRGMMVNPFVKNLALKLNDEINSRLNNLN